MGCLNSITVEISDVALPNNYGVAKRDGLVIFVPETVVGDRVRIRIQREQKRLAYASVEEILAPSPFRAKPECPHFGFCGGCTLQDVAYEKQLEIKQTYLTETLRRIGGLDLEKTRVNQIIPSPELRYYRNKLELSFGDNSDGIVLGLRERVSPFTRYEGKVLPIRKCLVSSPIVESIIPVFVEFAHKHHLTPYNPITNNGLLRHLVIRESKSTNEIMVLLETKSCDILQDIELLGRALSKAVPEVKSLYWAVNNKPGDGYHPERVELISGKPYLVEILKGITFRVLPGSFFQPNTKAAEILYQKIPDFTNLKNQETVLGLYCGTGPIEIFLSRIAKQVVGIDCERPNITSAGENCRLNDVKNCRFYEGKVEKVLRTTNLKSVDLLVLDPPRGGVSAEGMRHISTIKPKKICYVSCSPPTLARDLKIMGMHGYKVAGIAPFDFFPHTPHVETLVALSR